MSTFGRGPGRAPARVARPQEARALAFANPATTRHDVCRAPSDGRVDQRDDERGERDEDDQEVDYQDRDVLAAGNIFAAPQKFKGAGDPICICHGLIAVFRGVEGSRIGAVRCQQRLRRRWRALCSAIPRRF